MDGQMTETSHSDSQPRLWMTSGRSVLAKSAKMTRHSEWMPCQEKFSNKAFRASSSRNWIWEGIGSKEADALERRGFRDGANFCLGVIDTTNVNEKRGRERYNQKSPNTFQIWQVYWKESTYAWEMHEHVTCNIQGIMGSAQSNPTITQSICTHLNAW